MADPARRRATYQDVLGVPSYRVAEILGGDLYVSPRPAVPHAGAAGALGWALTGPFRYGIGGPGGWLILPEPELHLEAAETPIVPDLAGWRRERMPEAPDVPAIELAPDWVCEILSARNAATDRSIKLPIYARANVRHAWLLDPIVQTVEVLRLDGEGWRLVGTWEGAARVRLEPFDAVELDLSLLWAR